MANGKISACAVLILLGGCTTMNEANNPVTGDNIARIRLGQTTREEVRTLFGPPARAVEYTNLQREVWDYPDRSPVRPMVLSVQFSKDGVVRETMMMADPAWQATGDR